MVVRSGLSADPRGDSGTRETEIQCVALMHPSDATLYRVTVEGEFPPQQSLAIANETVMSRTIGGAAQLQSAAWLDDAGNPWVSVISARELAAGLEFLQAMDCDPDLCIPSACLVPVPEKGFMKADIGGCVVIRGTEHSFPDEPALVDTIVGDELVTALDSQQVRELIGAAASQQLLNLRSGKFVKKSARKPMTSPQKRLLLGALAAIAVISLAIPITVISKHKLTTANVNADSLALARGIVPGVNELPQARQQIGEKLKSIGQAPDRFTALTSIFFQSLQSAPGVAVVKMSYQPSGLLSATLSAARNEDINVALLALQRDGYKITAVPRTEATGKALADITVGVR